MTTEKVTEDLLRRARAGDAKAVHDVVQKIEPGCRVRIGRVLLGAPYASRADIDDILQETLLVFLRTEGGPADRWEPAKGSFENFAAGKAEHLALDLRRKRRKEGLWFDAEDCESAEPEVDSSRTPERQLASRQILKMSLEVCQAEQSAQGRELFRLLILERRSVREVAQMMCMEPAAVYAWRSRLTRRLKEIAQRMGGSRVNKERQTDHLAHSLLSANVLDDPRWEKLALGTASPEEIESLRAWAQHSYMARRAWDLFRPAMEKEKAAITMAVLERRMVAVHNVGAPNVGEQTVRRSLTSELDVQAKPIDPRMMSRHARREQVGSLVDAAKVMAVASPEFMAPLGMKVCRREPVRTPEEPQMGRVAADEPTKRDKLGLGATSRSRAVLREACGTTSSVGVVCRDIVDTSSVGAVASTLPDVPPVAPRRRVWDAQWFVLGATALYMALVVIAGAMVWNGKRTITTSSSNVPPVVSSVELSVEVRPETTVPAKTADDKFHYAKPALSVSSLPAGAGSARPTAPRNSLTNLRLQLKSPSAPIPMVKRKPVYREVCTGVGLFRRCKTVLVESVTETLTLPDRPAFDE